MGRGKRPRARDPERARRRDQRISWAANVTSVAFFPDGRRVATASWDRTARIWDLGTGREVDRLSGHTERITSVAVSPDGRLLASGGEDRAVRLWDVSSQRAVRVVQTAQAVHAVAFSPDGRTLAVASDEPEVRLFDAASGSPSGVLKGHTTAVLSLSFAPDGKALAAAGWSGLAVWDMPSQKQRFHVPPPENYGMTACALSRDGRVVAVAQGNLGIRCLDAATGHELGTMPTQTLITSLAFSPTQNLLVGGRGDRKAVVWDADAHKEANRLEGHSGSINALAVSPDGFTLVASGIDGLANLWDLASGRLSDTLSWHVGGSAAAFSADGRSLAVGDNRGGLRVWDVGFSPDGATLVMATDRAAILWDVARGKARATLSGHACSVLCAKFLKGGRVVATSGWDTTIKFWDVSSGALLATAVALDHGRDWVATSPEGLFDGSSGGQAMLEWRLGDKTYALDQFFNQFYVPGLLGRLLHVGAAGGDRSTGALHPQVRMAGIKPPPRVTIVDPPSGARTAEESVTVRVSLEDQGGGVSSPRLYLNGHRVPDGLRGEASLAAVAYSVPLLRGKNQLRATAFNQDGTVERRGDEARVICLGTAAQAPVLHVLAIGINQYRSGLRLGFASADARAMAGFFRPGLFATIKPHVLLNGQADKAGILAALQAIRAEATTQDTVVLYLAGHGTLVGDLFYYLPYDAEVGSDEALRRSGLSSVELGDALSGITATRQIVILDACHSGASATALGRLVANRDAIGLIRAQQRLARSSGTFLVAAATAEQYAREFPELGHGVLTYAILTALGEKGGPRRRSTGTVR